jgi:hypothetical protein
MPVLFYFRKGMLAILLCLDIFFIIIYRLLINFFNLFFKKVLNKIYYK